MELSHDTIRELAERFEWDYCSEYGEPGYTLKEGGLVVLGNYWCRCGKVLKDGKAELHGYELHHPRVFAQLEAQGVEFHWYDEWVIDYDNDKAYRTQPNCYQWQPSLIITENGDFLTPDDDLDTWLEWAMNESHRCLPSKVWSSGDLVEAGWESYNGRYENGWHEGMTDNPDEIVERIHREKGEGVDVVFLLDETSQFYIGFSAWIREKVGEED